MTIRILGTSAALALLVTVPAFAQLPTPFSSGGRQEPTAPKVAPPPALPGATAKSGDAAPQSTSSLDLEPTDALFDAINRGNIAAARDAISRGADLHGHNILGMTPLELSIDLGRNDISFMLLSMRGDEDRPSQPVASAGAAKPASTKPAKQTADRRSSKTTPVVAKESAQTQTARLFGGDGGAPIPNAGFLGFDPTRR